MAESNEAQSPTMSEQPQSHAPAGPCRIEGCPGHYEQGTTDHLTRHDGTYVLVRDLPAEICTVCGDYVMRGSTVEQMDHLLDESEPRGIQQMPVYAFQLEEESDEEPVARKQA